MFHIIQFGLTAGAAMIAFGTAMNLSGLTKYNITEYLGSLVTGKKSGMLTIVWGIALRFIWSIGFAFIYVVAIHYFAVPVTLQTALIFTVATMVASEFLLRITNLISPGVKSKQVQAVQFLAFNYGASGLFSYVLGHAIYALVFFSLLGAPLQF